jgi:2-polyprenyl-3-methyl-5-hydroxy-6-metoxy-1,4-benzoquinol methylase
MPQIGVCPACSALRWRPPRPGGFHFHHVHYRRVQCAQCGLMGLDPIPEPELWPLMYSDGYFEAYSVHHSSCRGYAAGKEVADRASETRLDQIRTYCASGRLLDVGCAGGHFLAAARKRGYDVAGVEYSRTMAAYAHATYGLEVLQGDFLELDVPGTFDVVHMEDVLEHLSDPLAALRKVQCLLAPRGLLIVDGPLERQLNLSLALLEANLRMRTVRDPEMAPAHIWQFTLKTQRRLVARVGFVECRAWVYQEPVPPLPRAISALTNLRRRGATLVNALSVWVAKNRAFSFLRHGDRALVIYKRAATS